MQVKLSCTTCGISLLRKPSYAARVKNPCCSLKCSAIHRSTYMRGDGNHQYSLKGELNSSYKSDIKVTNYGYLKIRVAGHPYTDHAGFILAHRAILEQYYLQTEKCPSCMVEVDGFPGKYLSREYIVHHIDGNKLNNLVSNLEVLGLAEHTTLHNKECPQERDIKTGRFIKTKLNDLGGIQQLSKVHATDAGLDVCAAVAGSVPARMSSIIPTGIAISIPNGCVGLLWSRSGLSLNHGVQVGAGCIDEGYIGELKVLLYNMGDTDFNYKVGDRIAQLLTIPINTNRYVECSELDTTPRATGGFGSTGV